MKVSLVVPAEYNEAAHQQAQKLKDYRKLSKTIDLEIESKGGKSIIEVPAISPWALLIVEADI